MPRESRRLINIHTVSLLKTVIFLTVKWISVTESTVESKLNMCVIQLSTNKLNIVTFFLLIFFHVFCINVDKHLKAILYYALLQNIAYCSVSISYRVCLLSGYGFM